MTDNEGTVHDVQTVRVASDRNEAPLLVMVVLASLAIYGFLVLSVFGAIYAVFIAAFLFMGHVVFVTHVRGSAVRLGPEQFPDLYNRVVALAHRAGLEDVPAAYLMQEGGALNAFATKLFRGRIIVLFSDLLEACGDDHAARDMVIGHELGHHKAGHLDWLWLTLPGRFVPFLGAAYSRACERTCDRWGAALCGDPAGAVRGLAILAAGGRFGPRVNLEAFTAQRHDLDTGWMTLGRWLSAYPPLSERVEALEPGTATAPGSSRGPLRAAAILGGCLIVPMAFSTVGGALWIAAVSHLTESLEMDDAELEELFGDLEGFDDSELAEEEIDKMTVVAESDLDRLAEALAAWHAAGRPIDEDMHFGQMWEASFPGTACPEDPFDGYPYGLEIDDGQARLFSSGPDAEAYTDDDIVRVVELGGGGP